MSVLLEHSSICSEGMVSTSSGAARPSTAKATFAGTAKDAARMRLVSPALNLFAVMMHFLSKPRGVSFASETKEMLQQSAQIVCSHAICNARMVRAHTCLTGGFSFKELHQLRLAVHAQRAIANMSRCIDRTACIAAFGGYLCG